MAIIIDGYNVLHASRWLSSSWKGADRQRLCRLLVELAKCRAEKITVVFDAAPAESARAESRPLEVIYSGHGRTADEVIIQMINKSTGPRDLTVVSSDRQIRTAAKRRGCKIKLAGEFIRISANELAQANTKYLAEPTEKRKGLSPSQTKKWLAEFGLNSSEEEDPYEKMYR